MNEALKYLVLHERDDLEELRKMIKSTKTSLKEYSGEVRNVFIFRLAQPRIKF